VVSASKGKRGESKRGGKPDVYFLKDAKNEEERERGATHTFPGVPTLIPGKREKEEEKD